MESNSNIPNTSASRADVIYQVSLMQSLLYGDFYGSVTLAELKQHGDTGLGTFDKLNGELIMLDGVVCRAAGNGSIETVSDTETTPFAVVTFLNADDSRNLHDIPDYDALLRELDNIIAEKGKNHFYMIRIDGLFRKIHVRSVYAQQEPYRGLVEVLTHDQTLFDYENTEGTIVGLYCPPYMSYLNAVGWHMHFISKDKTKGGHVLGAEIARAILTWDRTDAFQVQLPHTPMFAGFDLTVDRTEDIKKVETNK